ncbi:hypothetical protein ES703_63172 [subsurface metagenome]
MPRRGEGGSRLTEGEASELDEHHFDRDIAAAGGVEQVGVGNRSAATVLTRGVSNRKTSGQRSRVVGVGTQGRELEVALTEGTDNAVFRGGAGINRQRHTGTGGEVVAVAVLLTEIARPSRLIVDRAVERRVDAQITTQLDAGVSARNVEESGTIQGADLHVFDRFGLHGKISSLCPTHGEKTRR